MTALPLFEPAEWQVRRRSDRAANELADRHYSRRRPGVGRVAGPGRALVLVTGDELATWVTTWPKYNADGLEAYRCSIFRNEGPYLSSDFVVEAMRATEAEWGPPPVDAWVTWVDTAKVGANGSNPGYCFLRAGWWRDRSYAPDRRRSTLIRLRAHAAGERS